MGRFVFEDKIGKGRGGRFCGWICFYVRIFILGFELDECYWMFLFR